MRDWVSQRFDQSLDRDSTLSTTTTQSDDLSHQVTAFTLSGDGSRRAIEQVFGVSSHMPLMMRLIFGAVFGGNMGGYINTHQGENENE